MNAKAYNVVCGWIAHAEGGYVDNLQDPGGETKYGISKKAFPNMDIKSLTIDEAMHIYNTKYWMPLQLDKYPFGIALFIFDTAILQGVSTAKKIIEVGIDSNNVDKTLLKLLPMRLWLLALVDDFSKFGKGWTNRIADLINRINLTGGIEE